jgi:hypothetical protein
VCARWGGGEVGSIDFFDHLIAEADSGTWDSRYKMINLDFRPQVSKSISFNFILNSKMYVNGR